MNNNQNPFSLRLLFSACLILLCSSASAQKFYRDFYPNKKVRSEGLFNISGKEDSLWRFYYEDGTIQEESVYRNGYFNGKVFRYHPNGKIQVEGYFKFGNEDSIQRTFNDKGIKIQEGNFSEGKKIGSWNTYYENGKIQSETSYADSIAKLTGYFNKQGVQTVTNGTGVLIEENDLGKTSSKTTYTNGIQDGLFEAYFSKGNIQTSGYYVKGIKDGKWNEFFNDGKLRKTTTVSYTHLRAHET
jgi:antitoxin component YwqK of YwqJK toxin-antitoxin module